MLTVHHLNASRSFSILWLLEELGLEYEVKPHTRTKAFRAPPELRAIHPLGKSPIVVDSDQVFAETGAIVEHILGRYGKGRLEPADGTEAAREFRYFLHYSEGSLMPPLLVRLIFDRVENAKLPFFVKPVAKAIARQVDQSFTRGEIGRHAEFLEQILAGRTWVTGDEFTAADIMVGFPLQVLLARGRRAPNETTQIRRLVDAMKSRDAYQRAVHRAGGDALER